MMSFSPIGYLKSSDQLKFAVPRQPREGSSKTHLIELNPGHNFEAALRDLDGFDRIWLIWWFHKNNTWRPCVMPPRGQAKRRGVFSTRSPHRPNQIGMSCVPLIGIKGRTLIIGDCDLIDGTPILDIKPYIAKVDSFPDAKSGWLDEIEAQYQQDAKFEVKLSELAQQQLNWLNSTWQIDFFSEASRLLARDPSPHRTRRIISLNENNFRMGCGAWRVFFSLQDKQILVSHFEPGYPIKSLTDEKQTRIADRDAQIAFSEIWI